MSSELYFVSWSAAIHYATLVCCRLGKKPQLLLKKLLALSFSYLFYILTHATLSFLTILLFISIKYRWNILLHFFLEIIRHLGGSLLMSARALFWALTNGSSFLEMTSVLTWIICCVIQWNLSCPFQRKRPLMAFVHLSSQQVRAFRIELWTETLFSGSFPAGKI